MCNQKCAQPHIQITPTYLTCVENAQDAVLFTCCLHFVLCLSQVAGAGAETAPEEALARVSFLGIFETYSHIIFYKELG